MDLYQLLGVTRDASGVDVERAYRRLARRYHPGINPGDAVAEQMYAQIQRAFEVLGDPARRREYDRGAGRAATSTIEATVSFQGFDFSAPAEGSQAATFSELFAGVFQSAAREATTPTKGGDLHVRATLSFEQAVRGGAVPISIARQDRCAACGGDGRVTRAPLPCPGCGGAGARRWARGHMVFTGPCEDCGGAGRLAWQACRACAGIGAQTRSEVVTLTTPPGLETGACVAVPGRGHVGARGGPAGDLYVTLDVADHPVFRRVGADLRLTVPIAVHEAVLGARVEVPTLDGTVRLKVPPGTSSGQQLRVRGAGIPARDGGTAGDLIAEVRVVVPPIRDERSRELMREFAALNTTDVRADLWEG